MIMKLNEMFNYESVATTLIANRDITSFAAFVDAHEGEIIAVEGGACGYYSVYCRIQHTRDLCASIDDYNIFMEGIKQFDAEHPFEENN